MAGWTEPPQEFLSTLTCCALAFFRQKTIPYLGTSLRVVLPIEVPSKPAYRPPIEL